MQAPRRNDRQATPDRRVNDPLVSRNAAACPGTNSSKHMDAAALALDLATASPWSNAISLSAASNQESMNDNLTSSQELNYSRNHIATEGTGLEPPPPYYPPHEYDLNIDSADPELEDMRPPATQQETTALDNPVHGAEDSEYEDNLEAPLLNEPGEKSPGGRYPWMRVNSIASIRTYRSWRLHAVIGLVVVLLMSGVLGFLHVCFSL